jgi:hypothetical protein
MLDAHFAVMTFTSSIAARLLSVTGGHVCRAQNVAEFHFQAFRVVDQHIGKLLQHERGMAQQPRLFKREG